MREEIDVGMKCIKYMLFVANFMFVMIGFLLISIGSTVKAIYGDFEVFMASHYFSPASLAVAIGILIFFIALFGCVGALKESTFLINLFAFFLTLILILEISASIAAYAMRGQIEVTVRERMEFTMADYAQHPNVYESEAWDFTQERLHCCGVDGPMDWSRFFPGALAKHMYSGEDDPEDVNAGDTDEDANDDGANADDVDDDVAADDTDDGTEPDGSDDGTQPDGSDDVTRADDSDDNINGNDTTPVPKDNDTTPAPTTVSVVVNGSDVTTIATPTPTASDVSNVTVPELWTGPTSCCRRRNEAEDTCAKADIYKDGCLDALTYIISECALLLGCGALAVAFIQVLGIIFAHMLAKAVRRLKTQEMVERDQNRQRIYEQLARGADDKPTQVLYTSPEGPDSSDA